MAPTRAFVFPGQGSQAVGMGRALAEAFPAAREVWEEADDALDFRLSGLAFGGPPEDLVRTENAQPALLANSMAVMAVLRREAGLELPARAAFVAGHSLGEYSALCAAGVLGLREAARLVRLRGRAMQEAVPAGEGAMAALLGADADAAAGVVAEAADGEVLAVGNDNAPGQIVVSGAAAAVARAVEAAPGHGFRRAVPLEVSAPFHCPLMEPAARAMEEALADAALAPPAVPVVANVTAAPVSGPDEIRGLLVEQVTAMVRWRESVLAMREAGVDTLVEAGEGRVLAGLARRIDPGIGTLPAAAPEEIEALVRSL